MTENGEPKLPNKLPNQIVITFNGPDSASLSIQNLGCGNPQIYLAAWMLQQWAEELRAEENMRQKGGKMLHVPIGTPSDRALGRVE